MSAVKGGVYQRGPYWLDLVRGAGGKPASSNFYIWWYDRRSGKQQRKSAGANDVRLACDALDAHYLATHRSTKGDQAVYCVSLALTDYYVEHGQHRISAESIRARLKLFSRFLDHEADHGRLPEPLLPTDMDERLLDRFRTWALADPIVARKKDSEGNWTAGSSRCRSPATVEESIIQVKAALRHAYQSRRTNYLPPLKHKTRDQVTPARKYRLSVAGIAEILDFTVRGGGNYAGHPDRLLPLRRYLIGAITTLGRPDSILDMSVRPEREQWMRREQRFDLNPAGRIQTRKVRPVLPVVDLLEEWLAATDDWFVCSIRKIDEDGGKIIQQVGVRSVRSAWETMRAHLKIPGGWGPKLVRYSIATILANRRADRAELEIAMGHRTLSKTTDRYVIFAPDYLQTISAGIEDVVSDLRRACPSALRPHAASSRKLNLHHGTHASASDHCIGCNMEGKPDV